MKYAAWLARLILLALFLLVGASRIPKDRWEAYRIAARCPSVSSSDGQAARELRECLEEPLITLVKQNPRLAVATTKRLLERGTITVPVCHGLLHKIGQEALATTGDIKRAFDVGSGEVCAAGYYHGIVELALSATGKQVNEVCEGVQKREEVPGGIDIVGVNCFHGLGHALMAVNNYDLLGSLVACDRLSEQGRVHCTNGVFMENSSPAHGTTTWLKADDPFFPCNAVGEQYRRECYQYVPDPLLSTVDNNFPRAFLRCEFLSAPENEYCAQGLSNNLGYRVANRVLSVEVAENICLEKKSQYSLLCINHVANTLVYQHGDLRLSGEFCRSVPANFRESCVFQSLATSSQFPNITRSEKRHYCTSSLAETSLPRCFELANAK